MELISSAVDTALEISVVGSFSRPGYRLRRRMFDWHDPRPGALDGRTIVVTGPTSGLGKAAATVLAGLGARLILVGRNAERLEQVREGLPGAGRVSHAIEVADMSSLASVRAAVDRISTGETVIDGIIDNAGAIHEQRSVTDDGLEATFATMVVGPFVLVSGLWPLLLRNRDARVVTVVSGGMYAQSLDLDDLQLEHGLFDGTRAYAKAKRAATAVMREWARRSSGQGVRFNAMHPGWADTPGLAESLPGFYESMRPLLRTPEEGVDTTIWLVTAARAGERGGELYLDRRPRPFDRVPSTRLEAHERTRLWESVVALSGGVDPLAAT